MARFRWNREKDRQKDESQRDKVARGSDESQSGRDPESYVYKGTGNKRSGTRNPPAKKSDPESYVYRGKKAESEEAYGEQPETSKASKASPDQLEGGPGKKGRSWPKALSFPWKRESGEGQEDRNVSMRTAPGSEKVFHDTSETDPHYWDKTLEQRYEENYPAERRILLRNIRRVAVVILAMFLGLMSYLVYFQVTMAQDLKADTGNRRNAEARNRVLRGSLYDREGNVLSESTLHDDGTQTREYLGGQAFGNILGYVSDKYSITGLEQSLDQTLSKNAGIESFFTLDFISSLLNPEQAVTRKQEGHSVVLTLDKDLQSFAYKTLDGRKGSVVALDPRTGEILAMVSSPGFSAGDLDEVMTRVSEDEAYAAKAPLINRAVRSVYAPGSTMKIVTLASAIDNLEGVEDRIFDDKGVIEFPDGNSIQNFNGNVYGEMDLQRSFTNSSNYVFGGLGIELTNDELKKTAEKLGFNREITMEGLKARSSVFPRLSDRELGNKALSALGQGEVAATPLQIAMVSAAVANDGRLASPYIVAGTLDKDGNRVEGTKPAYEEALDPDTARKVKDLMAGNIEHGGSSYRSLSDIDGAGKTGTGEVETGDGMRLNSWFTGFAPTENPEIAIAVVLEDLQDSSDNTGSRQALPVAREIMNFWLKP